MSENSKIEWTDHTFNPWEGCQKVGPGCDHCYAETRNARFAGGTAINWGPGAPRRRTSASNWAKPLQWNSEPFYACSSCGWRGDLRSVASTGGDIAAAICPLCSKHVNTARPRVFCASLADVFDNAVDPAWREDLFQLIAATQNLDWLLLTKRIGNVGNMLPVPFDFAKHYPNVWLGATITSQEEADRDIPKLLALDARVRFLSMEPLLGPVSFEGMFANPRNPADGTNMLEALDWVIVGGESGPGARPMHPDWARSLRDQCQVVGTPFLFKQWGEWAPTWVEAHFHMGPSMPEDPAGMEKSIAGTKFITGEYHDGRKHEELWPVARVGKKAAGRLLDGRTWDEAPAP